MIERKIEIEHFGRVSYRTIYLIRAPRHFLSPFRVSLERYQQKIDRWNLTHIFTAGHENVKWVSLSAKIYPIEVFIAGDTLRIC